MLFEEITQNGSRCFPLPLLTDQGTEALNCIGKDLGQCEKISVHLKTLFVCLKYVVML